MIRLCLFDLDQTLVDTEDMKELREAGVHRNDAAYADEVRAAFRSRQRILIKSTFLKMILHHGKWPQLGIFTRSPRRYVDVILTEAYPDIRWATVIAYEDVRDCKPNGEGILRAMQAVGMGAVDDIQKVLVIGDSDVDIRAAYHAGCRVALFKPGWPRTYGQTHWRSLGLLPDIVINDLSEIVVGIVMPLRQLPYLEYLLEYDVNAPPEPRFDDIGKFYPNDRTRHPVYTAGRYFALYGSLDNRRAWHFLSQSIQANKESVVFPAAWVETVKRFIANCYQFITANPFNPELVITAIPARPGRVHRLGHLIAQLQASYGDNPKLNRLRLTFDPNVFAYRPGVQSQSRDHLTQEERFANVRDHLFVVNPAAAQGKKFLVIDDVTTTGATLLYAKRYLTDAGARSVDCFSLAQTITDPLRLQ